MQKLRRQHKKQGITPAIPAPDCMPCFFLLNQVTYLFLTALYFAGLHAEK